MKYLVLDLFGALEYKHHAVSSSSSCDEVAQPQSAASPFHTYKKGYDHFLVCVSPIGTCVSCALHCVLIHRMPAYYTGFFT